MAVFHGAGKPFEIREYPHEAFAHQDKGHVTRAAIVPN